MYIKTGLMYMSKNQKSTAKESINGSLFKGANEDS